MLITLILVAVAVAAIIYRLSRFGAQIGPVVADEIHTVTTSDLWRIRLCRYKPEEGQGQPVFMVHGFMANQFNFSMPEGESAADLLADAGYDCWLIDLRGCVSSTPPFGQSRNEPTIEDYVFKDIPAAIDYIRQKTGYTKVHWVGHSMGGMLLYAYGVACGTDKIATGITIGSPICFEGVRLRGMTPLVLFRHMPSSVFRGIQRLVILLSTRLHPKSRLVPVNWKNMNPRFDARAFSHVVEAPPIPVSKEMAFSAKHKVWRVKNDEVDVVAGLDKFNVPLFAIFGGGDPFVPLYTLEDFLKKFPAKDKKMLILSKENGHSADYSHVDLLFGRHATEEVFEPMADWLDAHPIKGRAILDDDDETATVKWKPTKYQVDKIVGAGKTLASSDVLPRTKKAKAAALKATSTAVPDAVGTLAAKPKSPAKKLVAKKSAAEKLPAKKSGAKKKTQAKPDKS